MQQEPENSSQQDVLLPASRKSSKQDDLYAFSQAVEKTGLPPSTFQRLVRRGLIPKTIPYGNKREGYYPKPFIDLLASHLQGKQTTAKEVETLLLQLQTQVPPPPQGQTDWIGYDDLSYVQQMDLDRYGPEQTVEMAVTYKWWEKNPYMCRILFNASDRRDVWGALTIMLLPKDLIYQLVQQKISEKDIRSEDILPFEAGKIYDGYIASVIIRPQYQSHLRALIQSILEFWCQHYPETQLGRLYAFGATDEGRQLIRHLYFAPRYDLGDNVWELDPMDPFNPSRILRVFRECATSKERIV